MDFDQQFPPKWAAFVFVILGISLPYIVLIPLIESPEALLSGNGRYYIFLSEIFIFLPALIYASKKGYSLQKIFRFRAVSISILAVSLLTGIGISIIGDEFDRLLTYFIEPPEWINQSLELFRISSLTDFLLIFGGIAIIAPFAEELLFRGYLQTSLEYREQNVTKAILITSLAFALLHLNTFWVVQIYIFGIILSYFSWRSQSIFPGILVHVGINGTSILLTNLDLQNSLSWYQLGNHVSPVWLAISAIAIYYGFVTVNNEYALDTRTSDTITHPATEDQDVYNE